ncbi:protein crumbs isoform X2 [Planococcus citri]|uniref:protein crumbs isoform X2 n=1 Tax=Planococcus citri TaxID=170843 RepID=UPI0031F7D869
MSYLTVALLLFCLIKLLDGVPQAQFTKDREAFFNKTSYLRLNPISLSNNQIGFNFRSCYGGPLFVQSSSSFIKNKISLEVTPESLLLSVQYSSRSYESKITGKFLDNKWHSFNLSLKSNEIILSTNEEQQILANYTYNAELLTHDTNIFDRSSKLTVGEGFLGCIQETPGVPLNLTSNDAYNVIEGCPLPSGSCTGCLCSDDVGRCEEDKIGKGRCVCKPGFVGSYPNCTEVPICASSPCKNGGICNPSSSAADSYFNCTCPPGFTEILISKNAKFCFCLSFHKGVAHYSYGNSVISCMYNACCRNIELQKLFQSVTTEFDGFMVSVLSSVFRECQAKHKHVNDNDNRVQNRISSHLCVNKDACFLSLSSFLSSCSYDGSGKLCQNPISECQPPCQHNGTCISTPEGYKCNCPPEYTGGFCEEDVDECKRKPSACVHGHCLNSDGSYQCFCTPGYTGDHCELDIDECLSHPCFNGATCINAVNRFNCICTPGYTGRECRININECDPNPCLSGGTCIDGNNSFTCECPIGLTGSRCEININDCESSPCQNGGNCTDGINSYSCNCTNTGFVGEHCEININDCAEDPCKNNATCKDLINDYLCECYPGYGGKNCEDDINECESLPCQHGGTCLEKSNQTLYNKLETQFPLPSVFTHPFNYANANGYECVCMPGAMGVNCEININECDSNPCKNGKCNDLLGSFTCECDDGFEGIHCENDIDECERYKPCVHGTCMDRKAGWFCDCSQTQKFGGKNCSVELIGCNHTQTCSNNGTCKPYLVGETQHKFNCTCPSGFHGPICEKITTMSLNGESHIVVNTTRDEGYDISFRFKTTLPSGLLALGKGHTFYILELVNGRLNLHSSLLNKWEGVFIGSELNNSNWQKVFVAINSSHVVLAANEEQTIYPINFNEAGTANQTSFPTTYVGGTVFSLRHLTHGPSVFIGCTENIVINGQWVIPEEIGSAPIEMQGVEVGCQRRDQCHPNPCHSGGMCTDLWKNFSCSCPRPYLGETCQYNLTAATFGHENITNSLVTVNVYNQAKKTVRNIVDISMFIRTRQSKGAIFYLGSLPGSVVFPEETFISAELDAGELLVRIQFNGTPEAYTVGGVKLNDGRDHLIQVIRNYTLVQVKINGTEYFRKTISASGPLDAPVLYLGGFPVQSNENETLNVDTSTIDFHRAGRDALVTKPDTVPNDPHISRHIRQTIDKFESIPNFKGVIQDVQINNGSLKMIVEFFPLKIKDLQSSKYFGVSFDPTTVLEGVLSDDTCRSNPCLNQAACVVTWNDYTCTCPHGYKGKQCQEMEFCQVKDCPTGSECRNLDHGYECVSNITMNGVVSNTSLQYAFIHNTDVAVALNSIEIMYRSKTGGTLLYLCNNEETVSQKHFYFSIFVHNDVVTVTWKLDANSVEQFQRIKKEHPDGEWTNIVIKITDNKIHGSFSGVVDEPGQYFSSSNFSSVAWNNLITTGTIFIGGGDSFLQETLLSPKHSYIFEGESGNAVDLPISEIIPTAGETSVLQSLSSHTPSGIFYRGCIGEVRIGGLLLPYFTSKQLKVQNDTTLYKRDYFELNDAFSRNNVALNCSLCFPADCQNGGKCSNAAESYSCQCSPGFDGEDCSHDVDECLGNRCLHGATCIDGTANYTCQCTTGWSGWLCDYDIDECMSQPCQNNGTCLDLLGHFKCNCTEDFVGKQCEQIKQVTCENQPCKNDARCSDTPNRVTGDNFTCSCLDGFIGTHCDETFCSVTPCRNKGLCIIKNKAPMCECTKGFTGKYCEENIDDCRIPPNGKPPCLHGGRCIDRIDSYDCNCTGTGYKGRTCEIDINECEEATYPICGDKGICRNEEGTYKCDCQESVCGYHCDLYDPCLEMPCQNGGTCHEECTEEPDYKCICPPDFVGKNCTEVPLYSPARFSDIALIGGSIVLLVIIALVGSLVMFFMMARSKRATRGTYSPSSQEYSNPRVELDNVMKPPPEERLI